jgi:DNA invertase Pin-like site-specific DNA recombinase
VPIRVCIGQFRRQQPVESPNRTRCGLEGQPLDREFRRHLGIEFVSFRENLDTGGPLGRAVVVIVSAVAELERNLIIERVRAGLRRARLEGRTLGRKPIDIDRAGLLRDRTRGLSLAQLAKAYKISRSSVARALKQSESVTPQTSFPSFS